MLPARHIMPILTLPLLLGACVHPGEKPLSLAPVSDKARDCLARAMYFESNRSSEAGMLAVGSVVMNRVRSPKFPDSVCAVVGQPNQFAPGVLTRKMGEGKELAEQTATEVLRGERHAKITKAMYFHTAGLKFPYHNMHYVLVAGGNAFYEKR